MFYLKNIPIEKPQLALSKIGMSHQSLKIKGRFKEIAALNDLVEIGAKEAGFGDRESYALQLAVCEALENIITHGYKGESDQNIEAHIDATPGELRIELWDDAPAFNPANGPVENDWSEDDPPVGGLGLLIIHKVMDEVNYKRQGKRNLLRMLKRKPSTQTGTSE